MKFSIIIPVHNAAGFLPKVLYSVKRQSFKDFELITICDSCIDNSRKIAEHYADVVLETDFSHDGLARQAGIDIAKGDWIIFLDDDDWFLHEFALQMISEALTDDVDVLLYGFIFRTVGYAPPVRIIDGKATIWPAVWMKCYRREFIKDLRFRNIKNTKDYATDTDWTNRLLQMSPRFSSLDQPLYYYNYMRKGSQTWTFEHSDN